MSAPVRRDPPTAEEIAAWYKHCNESPALGLAYVKQHAKRGNPQSVIDAIDAFAATRQMINVGPIKGAIIDAEIRKTTPKIMAELGSYAGYSTVRFAAVQREVAGPNAHFHAFEFSPEFAEIVKEIVEFAGLSSHVTVHTGSFADNCDVLKGETVGIYFIDHDKSVYVADAKRILASGTLAKGSLLVADNVVTPGAPDYIAFLQTHAQFTSTMHDVADGRDVDAVMVSEFQGYAQDSERAVTNVTHSALENGDST